MMHALVWLRRGAQPLRFMIMLSFLNALGACRHSPSPTPVITTSAPTTWETPTLEASPTATPTPVTITTTEVLEAGQPEQSYLLIPTPVDDPLRFVFPTPRPAMVSAWRPPLYPTPWAPTPQDHFYFARPIAADEINWPLPDYRYGGVFLPDVVHTGIDIPAPQGTPVLAAGAGRVVWAGTGLYQGSTDAADDPYGLAVAIKHDFGYQGEHLFTVYGHLSRIDVVKGQAVGAGEVLGLVGQTGKVTGPHLHFEVRIGRNTFSQSRNPELWLSPPQGWGVLVGRVMNTSGFPIHNQEAKVVSKNGERSWKVITYGEGAVNSDPYYRENLVLGDLPAGDYTILIAFAGTLYNYDIHINPGMVTYFRFQGRKGFYSDLPPTPDVAFTPPDSLAATP